MLDVDAVQLRARLAVIPLVVAACVIPNIGPEVATKFNAAGEVTRWGKSYELLALPVLNLLLSVATYFTAGRQHPQRPTPRRR